MKALAMLLVLFALGCLAVPAWAEPVEDIGVYLWQTPRVRDIDATQTAGLIDELAGEIDRVLEAGPLAPLRASYADIPIEAYYVYAERGRIITTLAWAWPHLPADRQPRVKDYVRDLLAERTHAPWTAGLLTVDDGAVRGLHGQRIREGRFLGVSGDGANAPTLHVLYGLWLYGDRTGDWGAIRPYWDEIKQWYGRSGSPPPLYGQMGAHIGLARLARRFGDSAAEEMAVAGLSRDLEEGQDLAAIARRLEHTRFAHFSSDRNRSHFPGDCWIFLDAPPEILRFLADGADRQQDALQRAEAMKSRYPLWWLHQAPYFTRWTGDEGVGAPPELMGMIYPVERWVRKAPADELAGYMRSTPVGIGDCYWLESLAQTIEAFGTVTWEPLE